MRSSARRGRCASAGVRVEHGLAARARHRRDRRRRRAHDQHLDRRGAGRRGLGFPVAKHGNRAASSMCGSADVLEALGVRARTRSRKLGANCLRDGADRVSVRAAPSSGDARRRSGPAELGVRTIFNVLGPLTNPAGANRQVVGVARRAALGAAGRSAARAREAKPRRGRPLGQRARRDRRRGPDRTSCSSTRPGCGAGRSTPRITACTRRWRRLRGGDAAFNAAALIAILEGERSPRADLVVLERRARARSSAGAAEASSEGMERAPRRRSPAVRRGQRSTR